MAGDWAGPGLMASFHAHYDDLLRYLTRRTGNPQQAADIAQDTYLRLTSVSEPELTIADPRAYLFRVAGNLAIDELRRQGRTERRAAPEDAAVALADSAPLPEAVILARERLRLLDEALAELPPNPRRALLLSRVEGHTFAQIAAALGVSESMVAKYVAQALRACRDRLDRADVND